MKSDAQKLKAVRDQILIQFLGLGWSKAHHSWSCSGQYFSPAELFTHLIKNVISLADTLDAPPVAPATLPSLHELPVLSTKADVDITNTSCYAGRVMELKSNAYREQDTRETWGQGDRYSEMQEFNQPNIDSSLVGFENEMFF
jgi:hypothetical protein